MSVHQRNSARFGFAMLAFLIMSCGSGGNNNALQEAKKTQEALQSIQPGTVATSATGYMMTAVVDGKQWSAASMMPPAASSRIIGYKMDDYIGLPYNDRSMTEGKTLQLGPDNAVDVVFSDHASDGWLTTAGEMEVTKTGADWFEGRFSASFKSSTGNNTLKLTNGFFRIPAPSHR